MRRKHGTDEIQAWVEYTKYKSSLKEPRYVIECDKYDLIEGSSLGRWTEKEYEKWLQGLFKFCPKNSHLKNYQKIADFVGSRNYSQVKKFGAKYFRSGGKIPRSNEELKKMLEQVETKRKMNIIMSRHINSKSDLIANHPNPNAASI